MTTLYTYEVTISEQSPARERGTWTIRECPDPREAIRRAVAEEYGKRVGFRVDASLGVYTCRADECRVGAVTIGPEHDPKREVERTERGACWRKTQQNASTRVGAGRVIIRAVEK